MDNEENLIQRLIQRSRIPGKVTDTPFGFFKVYPPVTSSDLDFAEGKLGFTLPTLLQRIYLQVGNGGIGPGFGLFALNRNGAPNFHMNIVDWYLECTSPTNPSIWPFQYLTICDWGDGITSAVKWTDSESPIYRVNGDQYEEGSIEKVMNFECSSLRSWLEYWLDGLPLFTLGTQNK